MTAFGELVHERSGHEELAFALGEELGVGVPDGAGSRIAELGSGLDPATPPLTQLSSLVDVVRDAFAVRNAGPFLLAQVLVRRAGHPDALTVLAVAVARRAGLEVDVVSDGGRLYLAHRELGAPFVADVARGQPLFDGRVLGTDLAWQCGHETAFATLRLVARRSHDTGDLATELAALALLLALPLSGQARSSYEEHHRHLLARLN